MLSLLQKSEPLTNQESILDFETSSWILSIAAVLYLRETKIFTEGWVCVSIASTDLRQLDMLRR